MPLNDIVNVVITRQTQTVTEQGFGIPMILGTNNRFMDLIRFYSSLDEVALDFQTTDLEYIAAQDIFSQVISPEQIAIGRRLVNNVDVLVETALTGNSYILNIDGNEITASSSSTTTYSVVSLSSDLVPGNRINVSVDGDTIGTITSIIDFDQDFVASNSIVSTINATPIAPVVFTTDQATTIAALATALAATADIATATVTGPRQITAVFAAAGDNTINSIVTTGGASQPDAVISEGGFVYTTSSYLTMQAISAAILASNPSYNVSLSPDPGRILTVEGPEGVTADVDSFVVTLGSTRPTVTITNPLQAVTPESIVLDLIDALDAALAADPSTFPVTASDLGGGVLRLTNRFPGTPWTLRTSTTITNPNTSRVSITQVQPNQLYTVTINGINFDYTSPNNVQTALQISSALVDIINASPATVPVTATNNNDGSFELESDNLNNTFSISVSEGVMTSQVGLIVLPLIAVNPVADDLTAINNANNTWYALIATSRDVQTVKDIAAWTEARIKLFGTASSDPAIINVSAGTDTTSIAAFLNQAGYVRTFVMYHQDAATDFPEAAWFGRVLPLEPGSETWKFKTLNGISYSNLTTTQTNNALNKKANIYEFVGGVGITENGTVAQGEYIDIIRGVDWLRARIQEFVFSLLVNTPKVAYTDAGIAGVQAQVMRALQLGVDNNFIAEDPQFIVTVPLAANVPPADKAARILRNVKFTATLAGAIHAVVIRGTVSV